MSAFISRLLGHASAGSIPCQAIAEREAYENRVTLLYVKFLTDRDFHHKVKQQMTTVGDLEKDRVIRMLAKESNCLPARSAPHQATTALAFHNTVKQRMKECNLGEDEAMRLVRSERENLRERPISNHVRECDSDLEIRVQNMMKDCPELTREEVLAIATTSTVNEDGLERTKSLPVGAPLGISNSGVNQCYIGSFMQCVGSLYLSSLRHNRKLAEVLTKGNPLLRGPLTQYVKEINQRGPGQVAAFSCDMNEIAEELFQKKPRLFKKNEQADTTDVFQCELGEKTCAVLFLAELPSQEERDHAILCASGLAAERDAPVRNGSKESVIETVEFLLAARISADSDLGEAFPPVLLIRGNASGQSMPSEMVVQQSVRYRLVAVDFASGDVRNDVEDMHLGILDERAEARLGHHSAYVLYPGQRWFRCDGSFVEAVESNDLQLKGALKDRISNFVYMKVEEAPHQERHGSSLAEVVVPKLSEDRQKASAIEFADTNEWQDPLYVLPADTDPVRLYVANHPAANFVEDLLRVQSSISRTQPRPKACSIVGGVAVLAVASIAFAMQAFVI